MLVATFNSGSGRCAHVLSRRPMSRRRAVVCSAHPDSPYDSFERAIQVINRVIDLGKRSRRGSKEADSSSSSSSSTGKADSTSTVATPERWVQFGAVYSSRLAVDQPAPDPPTATALPGSSNGSRLLRDYLALPIDQYSLLDPKWISRVEGELFKFSLPLQDLVNVDMQPEIFISVLPEPRQSRVSLVGTRAALGSPEIDKSFKLKVTVLVNQLQWRRLPLLPRPLDHLPGRPVFRLRRWAAAARGRTWPPPEDSSSAGQAAASSRGAAAAAAPEAGSASAHGSSSNGAAGSSSDVESGTSIGLLARQGESAVVAAAAPEAGSASAHGSSSNGAAGSSSDVESGTSIGLLARQGESAVVAAAAVAGDGAPFPGQHVYISHDSKNDDEYADAELAVAQLTMAELDERRTPGSASSKIPEAHAALEAAAANGSWGSSLVAADEPIRVSQGRGPGQRQHEQGRHALLHCHAEVMMAVQVPGALNVIPNALLGYAGSLLLHAVLTATLPNFLDLLAADYRRWAGLSGPSSSRDNNVGDGSGGRQLDAPVGQLFADAATTVREAAAARGGGGGGEAPA